MFQRKKDKIFFNKESKEQRVKEERRGKKGRRVKTATVVMTMTCCSPIGRGSTGVSWVDPWWPSTCQSSTWRKKSLSSKQSLFLWKWNVCWRKPRCRLHKTTLSDFFTFDFCFLLPSFQTFLLSSSVYPSVNFRPFRDSSSFVLSANVFLVLVFLSAGDLWEDLQALVFSHTAWGQGRPPAAGSAQLHPFPKFITPCSRTVLLK